VCVHKTALLKGWKKYRCSLIWTHYVCVRAAWTERAGESGRHLPSTVPYIHNNEEKRRQTVASLPIRLDGMLREDKTPL
jgi:hypothetical protein